MKLRMNPLLRPVKPHFFFLLWFEWQFWIWTDHLLLAPEKEPSALSSDMKCRLYILSSLEVMKRNEIIATLKHSTVEILSWSLMWFCFQILWYSSCLFFITNSIEILFNSLVFFLSGLWDQRLIGKRSLRNSRKSQLVMVDGSEYITVLKCIF